MVSVSNKLLSFLLTFFTLLQPTQSLKLQQALLRTSDFEKVLWRTSFKVAIVSSVLALVNTLPAHAIDLDNGSALFTSSCSGCHAGGSNLFSASKTLFMKDLIKYKYDTPDAMKLLINKGKGQMPAYGTFISPKGNVMPAKYSDPEIEDIAAYVLDQASSNWAVAK
jgi:cytochrome c6